MGSLNYEAFSTVYLYQAVPWLSIYLAATSINFGNALTENRTRTGSRNTGRSPLHGPCSSCKIKIK